MELSSVVERIARGIWGIQSCHGWLPLGRQRGAERKVWGGVGEWWVLKGAGGCRVGEEELVN